MKKLLFLASFVFETGEIEYKDNQLVLVTDRDVQRFMEKQKALNPDKGERGPYEHYDAAYDVFRTWFEEVFPESTLKHIMCKRPIQSGLFFPKIEAAPESIFNHGGWHTSKETPTLVFDSEGLPEDMSVDVLIDVDGNRKTFRVGYYDIDFETKEGTWTLYGDERIDIELDHMKWTYLPLNKE